MGTIIIMILELRKWRLIAVRELAQGHSASNDKAPWTARRSNQSVLKEINPDYLLEGLMLKLKLQYFGHRCKETTHWKRPWCLERLRAGGEGDDRGWDGWMALLTQWTWVWANSTRWWRTGKRGMLQSMGSQRVRHDWATEQQIFQEPQPEGQASGLWHI